MKTIATALVALSLSWTCLASPPLQNTLANHPSPYLALHGHDPVHWQSWSEDVLRRAREENKLILVSSGYFSCHWCHVMQRESFQDKAVAGLLNKHFIAVKVDRELRPALDQTLINFVEATRGRGGWPLNVFLTPQGYPLFGDTYMPKANFISVLEQLRDRWTSEQAELAQLAMDALAEWRPNIPSSKLEPGSGAALMQAFVKQAIAASDPLAGGFGNQNKFPSTPQLNALLDAHQIAPNEQIASFLGYTLFMMASQGLRDQIGGGFFRYTVDQNWQVPHFEKMLYNNALLASLYLRAARVLNKPALASVALDTLDFVERELHHPEGGYIASLSAVDDQNVEGGYYLWEPDQLEDLLSTDEYAIARLAWKLDQPSSFDHGYLPVQSTEAREIAKQLKQPLKKVLQLSASTRAKLLRARQSRTAPADHKRLSAWNALLLSAFIDAARHGETRFAQAAEQLHAFITDKLLVDGEPRRSFEDERALGKASLKDYAYAARALWQYGQWQNRKSDRELAKRLVERAWTLFEGKNGWRLSADSLLPFEVNEPHIADGPMPSPSAVLIDLTLQMAATPVDKSLKERALAALYRGNISLQDEPYFHASQIMTLARYENE